MRKEFIVRDATCKGCIDNVREAAIKAGAKDAGLDLATGKGYIVYEDRDPELIIAAIESSGYRCEPAGKNGKGVLFIAAGILLTGLFAYSLLSGMQLPTLEPGLGIALLFVLGLLTGFHCIAMCGGFVVGYSAEAARRGQSMHGAHAQYAVGKVISYTVIGAVFGLIGSAFAFSLQMRGIAGILAGIFLLLFGARMLGLPFLQKFSLPNFFKGSSSRSPLVIGLLNGLMIACGPLQALYVMAAGTGSMIEGGKMLFAFALGTLPAMLGFAYFASLVSSQARGVIFRVSGLLVIVMGLFMINNGLGLTGYPGNLVTGDAQERISEPEGFQEIRMDVTASGWSPNSFQIVKGVPVRWIINGKQITNCNNEIVVPELGLEIPVKPGEQVVEFTAVKTGTIRFTCWMGMIPGRFVVVDEVQA